MNIHAGWDLHQIQITILHYLQRVEENKLSLCPTSELVWHSTGQYSDIGLTHINLEKFAEFIISRKIKGEQHLFCSLLTSLFFSSNLILNDLSFNKMVEVTPEQK